jgi:transcription elongation factor GreA
MEEIYFSADKKQELEAELHQLTNHIRSEVAKEIEVAKSHGDLSENAEYSAARARQAKVENRIRELEHSLKHGQVISNDTNDVVKIGHQVLVLNLNNNNESQYSIVGSEEQNILEGKISHTSPIAQALIGNCVGDVVETNTPSGILRLEIKSIN